MAVREQRHIAARGGGPRDHPPGARGHLLDGFALRHRRRPDGPARHAFLDLGAGAAFVSAVVPFAEIGIRFGPRRRNPPDGRFRARAAADWSAPGRRAARRGTGRSARRGARPPAVRGRSVRPVCCPERLHSVSP